MNHRVFHPLLRSRNKLQHAWLGGECRHFGTLSVMGYISHHTERNILSNPSFQVIRALRALMATTVVEQQSHPPASEPVAAAEKEGKGETKKSVVRPK